MHPHRDCTHISYSSHLPGNVIEWVEPWDPAVLRETVFIWNCTKNRIIERPRLEKTSRITKSNPNPSHRDTKLCPSVPHLCSSGTPLGMFPPPPPLPGQQCQCITTPSENKLFLLSNLTLLCCNLKPSPPILSLNTKHMKSPLQQSRASHQIQFLLLASKPWWQSH